MKRVVITGMGAITPIGNNVEEFWLGLTEGRSGAGEITRFDSTNFKTHIACEVKGYDPLSKFDPKEARKLDLFAQFSIVAADEAIADAGLTPENTDYEEVGVIWTSGIGGINSLFNDLKEYFEDESMPRLSPFFIPRMIVNMPAGLISIRNGFGGANFATISACASSANAIIEAFNYVRNGTYPVMLAGGAEAAIGVCGIGGFNSMKALSTRNDDPATASRPFDLNRDGFVMGEGSGGLVLEEYEHAVRRGAKIYAEIVGAGLSADAYHMTQPHPEGKGASLSMRRAINDAGITPEEIDHINTHGTSTTLGDIAEVLAIKNVFGEHAYNISINSTKSMTGHLLGGAGAVESIAAILSVKNGVIPPTINHFDDDPQIDNKLDFTFNEKKKRDINFALSNAFGFGGHNTSIIFKKYQQGQ